jgi:transcriptional regulator GlxA family with amidase domain
MTYKGRFETSALETSKGHFMHRIGYVLSDGFQVMALATQSAFEYANLVAKDDFYAVENYSESGGEVRSSLGMSIGTRALSRSSVAQTWIVAGVNDPVGVTRACSRAAVPAACRRPGASHRGHLHRWVRAGTGRLARRSACHHALGLCPGAAQALPGHPGRGKTAST